MDMMKIEEVVGDIILIILEGHEPLQKIGIETDKIFGWRIYFYPACEKWSAVLAYL